MDEGFRSAFMKKKKNPLIAAVNFRFNGWAKYDNFKKDEKLPSFIPENSDLEKVNSYP